MGNPPNLPIVMTASRNDRPSRPWLYFQLTRLHMFPLGNIKLIWPGLWSLTLVAYKVHMPVAGFLQRSVVCVLAGTLVHSTACVLNDICDIDFDRQGKRTKNRPLAAGLIPVSGAWTLLAVMTIACVYLLSFANADAAILGLFGLFPLHGLYPLMKRWTTWPQAWLGAAMNWGCIVVWISVEPTYTREDTVLLIVMLSGCACWTIIYDTMYASQDREDDLRTGARSTAVTFGRRVYGFLTCFAICFLASLALVGRMNDQRWPFFVISVGGTAVHLAWQLVTWDNNDDASSAAMFKANGNLGYIVWAGMLVDYIWMLSMGTWSVASTKSTIYA
ncbi:UbiA prenyltransferase [Peniophora sp. CONT]|nr:UbiA prenyltransferase [Peniophora sp. CONT]